MNPRFARSVITLAILTGSAVFYFNGTPQAGETAAVHGYDYICDGQAVTLRVLPGNAAEIQLGDEVIAAQSAAAASGTLYTATARGAGGVSLHSKGDGAVLTRNGSDVSCALAKADTATTDVAEDQTRAQAAIETADITLTDVDWQVETLDGKAVPADVVVTLNFADDRVSGNAGCNGYGGDYTATDMTLTFGALMSTQMACETPHMETELRFLDLMAKVTSYTIDESRALNLQAGDTTVITLRPVIMDTE